MNMKSHNSLKIIYQLVLTNDNFILYGQTNIQIALNMKRVTSDELISIIESKRFGFCPEKMVIGAQCLRVRRAACIADRACHEVGHWVNELSPEKKYGPANTYYSLVKRLLKD